MRRFRSVNNRRWQYVIRSDDAFSIFLKNSRGLMPARGEGKSEHHNSSL